MHESEFRVEKQRTAATVTLSNGCSVRGSVWVLGSSAGNPRPERVKDLLNAEPGFFPFEIADTDQTETVLYHRDHVVCVTLPTAHEPTDDPGYEVATRRTVEMLLSTGTRLQGAVRVYSPRGRDRLSDFARAREQFRYLELPDSTIIFNSRHVLELVETSDS
jgi:hypothetical protein